MESKNGQLIRALYVVGGIVLGSILFLAANLGQAAPMNTFTVNTLLDTDDGACDGVHCSLREAIIAANIAAGADIIHFTLPPSATITLNGTQLPIISDTLTIEGSTAVNLTINGAHLSRIFQIGNGTAVTLTAMTIINGNAECSNCSPRGDGAGILSIGGILHVTQCTFKNNSYYSFANGGAIANIDGILTVNTSTFTSNGTSMFGIGGAIYSNGTVTITHSIFNGNQASIGGGIYIAGNGIVENSLFNGNMALDRYALFGTGGGIMNRGTLTIRSTSFRDNSTTGTGGGISNEINGMLTVDSSSFESNSAYTYYGATGGGLYNLGTATVRNSNLKLNSVESLGGIGISTSNSGGGIFNGGLLTLINSTISENSMSGSDSIVENLPTNLTLVGSGIYNGETMTVTNSTISSNHIQATVVNSDTTVTVGGGGIYNDGTLTVNNSTINANSISANGNLPVIISGIESQGILNLRNTIIANSIGGQDCGAVAISANINNLIEDGSCAPAFSGDPLLGLLQSNGGQTPTQAPMPGSLAIDNGDNAACEPKDQRNVPRPIDGDGNGTAVCDIGSVEVGGRFMLMPLILKAPN